MRYLDVGGGLAVDYDGSRPTFTLQELQRQGVRERRRREHHGCCNKAGDPTITPRHRDRGRARNGDGINRCSCSRSSGLGWYAPAIPRSRSLAHRHPGPSTIREGNVNAETCREEALRHFPGKKEREAYSGSVILTFVTVRTPGGCTGATARDPRPRPQMRCGARGSHNLERVLAAIYYCNFSVFQSAPDTWAIDNFSPFFRFIGVGGGSDRSRDSSRIWPAHDAERYTDLRQPTMRPPGAACSGSFSSFLFIFFASLRVFSSNARTKRFSAISPPASSATP